MALENVSELRFFFVNDGLRSELLGRNLRRWVLKELGRREAVETEPGSVGLPEDRWQRRVVAGWLANGLSQGSKAAFELLVCMSLVLEVLVLLLELQFLVGVFVGQLY